MSAVVVIWVGRRASASWEALAGEYGKRIARHLDLAEVRIRPGAGRGPDPVHARVVEANDVQRHLAPGDFVVALDETGRERTTEGLAAWLADRRRDGRRLVFVVGSDLGLDDSVKGRADEVLSLSRLTLPHELARVLLLEQLYRALDLAAGGRYHRGRL